MISTPTHIGKIGRLDPLLREHLNERLAAGEPGKDLVRWLNANDSVREVLKEHFEGRPITEQNLSEWKQHGFQAWQHHQEIRAEAWQYLAEAEQVGREIGDGRHLLDQASQVVALTLLRMFHEAASAPEKGPKQRAEVLTIARELARWRASDHQRQRRQLEEERLEDERWQRELADDAERMRKHQEHRRACHWNADFARQEYCEGLVAGTLNPEREAEIVAFFAKHADLFREMEIRPLPPRGLLMREARRVQRAQALRERLQRKSEEAKAKARASAQEDEDEDEMEENLEEEDENPGEEDEADTEEIQENPSKSNHSAMPWMAYEIPGDPFKGENPFRPRPKPVDDGDEKEGGG